MTALRDTAKAKLNLTLEVLGRRADGYHEVRSLVAFAEFGDGVELELGDDLALVVEGPFAGALQGTNLVIAAAEAARAKAPGIALARFRLSKNLPVAAGLGGGSADAAAALRLLAKANPGALAPNILVEIAGTLGSDVTACLARKPTLISGRGEKVSDVRGIAACGVLLANPGVPLATARVYGALNAAPLSPGSLEAADVPDFGGSFARLIDYAAPRGNDLAAAASRLAPVIGDVLTALRHLDGARFVQIAGSGPTCFALFATEDEAKAAEVPLQAAHPSWWIRATTLGGS
jgi:4-diphosphocytidyl-2-C-methyl-D-erythritol kinase